jgi:hypothetical protein
MPTTCFCSLKSSTRRQFIGLDDARVVKPQVKSVGFAVNFQLHSLPFIVRSKYTLTTRSGATVVLTTTLRTRFSGSRYLAITAFESGVGRVGQFQLRLSQHPLHPLDGNLEFR